MQPVGCLRLIFLKISLTESPYREKSFTLHPGYGDLLVAWAHSFGSKVKQVMDNGGPIGRCHSLWSPWDSVNKRRKRAGPPLASVPSLDIYCARNIGEMLNFTLPPARCVVRSSVSSNFLKLRNTSRPTCSLVLLLCGSRTWPQLKGSYCIALLNKPGVCWRVAMASSQQAFFSSSPRSEGFQQKPKGCTDHDKVSLRHNSSPGALSV